MTTATFYTLPIEILENIAFYYVCPRVLGPPVPLTVILLLCKAVSRKLIAARHLYARVFKYKFSFSAIQRRGFEPRTGEWAWQLRRYTQVLRDVWNRRKRPGSEAYVDDVDFDVQGTMYVLWIMCLEDDGCNRAQMQLAGVYEWVEGYIRTEMYKNVEKGWPIANAGNSCAMWVFWHLTSKARLMDESTEQRESLINLILPFLTVPFRYPSSLAPANHFRLPLRSSAPSSSSTSFSIPTPHGPYPIYLQPSRYTWVIPHFERWTPLCTPLAADAAKLVYFSRRETIPFGILNILPRNREEHRDRVHFNSDGEPDEETTSEFNDELLQDVDMEVGEETECQGQVEQADDDMQRNSTMFNGYPQQGTVYTPGSLNGLWTGRMIVTQEAGHRPVPFTEDTLGLAAVPLYLRLSEYVVYFGGQPIPCMNLDDAFDQGIKDSWFPPNTTLSTKGDRVIATVPSFGTNNVEEYEYVAIQNNDINADDIASSVSSFSTPTLSRGMGSERCPGCISRERALLAARTQDMNIEVEHYADGSEELIEDLPPYVPSDKTIPPCNGVLDVLITGGTDPRHAAAWGNWVWRGRVRKWDGLVGLVGSVDSGPTGSRPGNSGKYFFYGTLLGGRNLVGTWRMAHEDPRLPAYEGAFTLGRKDE
ncbi:hypothetical protein F5879DRAFT_802027 [Lentinula edodes]|nr:hypothetical protein F5879DRAFT_802027 [Lentinula edodes]